jgi:hypothetical protein
MQIRRGITHKVQMPNQYESVQVIAEITADTEELGTADPDIVFDKLDELLEMAVETDFRKAQKLSAGDSYAREWE